METLKHGFEAKVRDNDIPIDCNNWGLAICICEYESNKKRPSAITLHKRLIAEVKSQNPWYYEVSKCAPQQALRDLERAF
ncbi:hypothetical protein [Dapis sp. BLCC M126]|uniref:hypothetical protein n=1 Tax=Dapis sp. BLCC M126 TaxID=3400189 RepID=UPI003CF2DCEA